MRLEEKARGVWIIRLEPEETRGASDEGALLSLCLQKAGERIGAHLDEGRWVSAPGETAIEATERAEEAFRIGGRIVFLPARDGWEYGERLRGAEALLRAYAAEYGGSEGE